MHHEALKELYVDELRDIYNAENQLVKALPKMAKAANSEDLRNGFEQHLEQTRGHVQRLEQIFKDFGEKASGKKCKGMEGLVAEGQEMMDEDFEGDVMDAALISAAQRVEHYEIAAYGTVRTYAELLGEKNAVQLLEQTLEEEKETDQKLTDLASDINVKAMGEDAGRGSAEEEQEGEETATPIRKKSKSARA
ncbi:MAG TPA: ferritin-like domain-containing protein [Candidatus Acidoferrum sp.]|jgi:ferritin-like metal-binding protein YciE